MKRGKSFAPIPKIRFLKEADGARREACSWHTTERGPRFLRAKGCPKNSKKETKHTHTQTRTHKMTSLSLNSPAYTCLNFPIVFSSAGARICHFTDMLIKPLLPVGQPARFSHPQRQDFIYVGVGKSHFFLLHVFTCASGIQR